MSKLNVVAIQNEYAEELEKMKAQLAVVAEQVPSEEEWAEKIVFNSDFFEKVALDEQEIAIATDEKACPKKSKDNKAKARSRRKADIRYKRKVKKNAKIADANYGKRFEHDCHQWNKRRIGCDSYTGVVVENVWTKSRSDKSDKLIKRAEKMKLFV